MTCTPDPITPEQDRANFIAEWKIHLPDVTVSDTFKTNMIAYRQSLRDIPSTVDTYLSKWSDMSEMVNQHWSGLDWPTKPSP